MIYISHCCRSILEGSKEEETKKTQQKTERDIGTDAAGNGRRLEDKEQSSEREKRDADEGRSGWSDGFRADSTNGDVNRRRREAFFACTRRSHETLGLFLQEVTRQGLHYSLAYQATMDADTALFVYNEIHLPIKVYRIILPQDHCVTLGSAGAADTASL